MKSLPALTPNFHAHKLDQLVDLALKKVLAAIQGFGNQISATHECALRELIMGLAKQALSIEPGRTAYALPCGAGKTQSVIALIAAANELCLPLTFAVSAAQILALGRIKHDLVHAGVPVEKIGLKHSKQQCEITKMACDASQPELIEFLLDTDENEFPIMLVCHARIRGAKEFPAFCMHKGEPRTLLIWDETLMTTDAEALAWNDVRASIDRLLPELKPTSAIAVTLSILRKQLAHEIESQLTGKSPAPSLLFEGADILAAQSDAQILPNFGSPLRRISLAVVRRLLRVAELPVAVVMTGRGTGGDGLIRYTVAVDPCLDNIAILDASHTIRLLGQERTIRDGTTPAMRQCKNYGRVQVIEERVAAGKSTLLDDDDKGRALARSVARRVRELPSADSVLFFTHKGDGEKSLLARMQADLEAEGLDLNEIVNGRKRFNWLTWGNETSLNTMSHCNHVILCGVMRRGPLELSASMAGQKSDLSYRMKYSELQALIVSEMAHCVLQAMNRGRCRTVDAAGMAGAMTLTVFVKIDGLKEALASSLPGIEWRVTTPAVNPCRTRKAADLIAAYLISLPSSTTEISVIRVKRDITHDLGKEAITEAINIALLMTHLEKVRGRASGWRREKRTLFRAH